MSNPLDQDHRLLTQVRLDNLLSFGPGSAVLPLENLNVFIGPNGSGKSNLIEAVALMRATPGDFKNVFGEGGGSSEWVWKGNRKSPATAEFVFNVPRLGTQLRHLLAFRSDGHAPFSLDDERIESVSPDESESKQFFFYRDGHPIATSHDGTSRTLGKPSWFRATLGEFQIFSRQLSVLAQLRNAQSYPPMFILASSYEQIRIYREWAFGRSTVFRQPQKADMRNDRLEEDFSNLGLYVNRLRRNPQAKTAVLSGLQDLYEGLTDFDVIVEGGTVQVFFTEGKFTIPATRLSDGTLRFLCLLAILHDPEPPPLICIEEPELGLHPDILPKLADHLVAASLRTQILVTTHSDILVDALSDRPEAVVVCEKHEGCTQMNRLSRDELEAWLERYRLGQLWMKGQLGGTRW